MLMYMWSKRNTPPLLVGLKTGRTILYINLAVPEKVENSSIRRFRYITPGIYTKDAPTYDKDTCSNMFIAVIFIIARSWK